MFLWIRILFTGGDMARPSDYKEEYCEMLIDHMTQGLSFDTFAGVVSVTTKTLYNWLDAHPEFLHAKEIGHPKRNLFVEKMYLMAATGRQIKDKDGSILKPSGPMMIYWTKNTLGWSDKLEHSSNKDAPPIFKLAYNLDELNESK